MKKVAWSHLDWNISSRCSSKLRLPGAESVLVVPNDAFPLLSQED